MLGSLFVLIGTPDHTSGHRVYPETEAPTAQQRFAPPPASIGIDLELEPDLTRSVRYRSGNDKLCRQRNGSLEWDWLAVPPVDRLKLPISDIMVSAEAAGRKIRMEIMGAEVVNAQFTLLYLDYGQQNT